MYYLETLVVSTIVLVFKHSILKRIVHCSEPLIEKLLDASLAVLSPFWYNLDYALSQFIDTSDTPLFKAPTRTTRLLNFIFHLILALVCLPLTVATFPIWLVLNFYRSKPFKLTVHETINTAIYDTSSKPRELTILSGNLCLLTELQRGAN